MPSVYSRFHYGTSKIVVLEPGFRVANCHVDDDNVVCITTSRELKITTRACSDMDFSFLEKKGWTCQDIDHLKTYCFVTGIQHSPTLLLKKDIEHVKNFCNNDACAEILSNKDICAVTMKRYEAVSVSTVIDMMLSSTTSFYLKSMKAMIGWLLLDIVLAGFVMNQCGMIHGDMKLNNLLFDKQMNRFRLTDLGMTRPYKFIDYERYGSTNCFYYHPWFKALHSLPSTSKMKSFFQQRYRTYIDRFAFVALIYQLVVAVDYSKTLSIIQKSDLKHALLQLMYMCKVSMRPPLTSNKIEQRRYKEHKMVIQKSKIENELNKKHWKSQKSSVGRKFCEIIGKHEIFKLKTWPSLFDAITDWMFEGNCQIPCLADIDAFLDSKKPKKKTSRSKRKYTWVAQSVAQSSAKKSSARKQQKYKK